MLKITLIVLAVIAVGVAGVLAFAATKPDVFTVQQYDGMRALDEALKALGGDTSDKDKFVKALEDVSFKSPRGDFAFDKTTHNPIQDIYIREVKTQNGQTVNTISDKIAKVTDPGK